MTNEIGRELKANELKEQTVVVLSKPDSKWHRTIKAITAWVVAVSPEYVSFYAGEGRTELMLKRTGPALEQVTDLTGQPIHLYEYLGEV